MTISAGRSIKLPDLRKWLVSAGSASAADAEEYDLHLAAQEWSLASALDINSRSDFSALPYLGCEPYEHQIDNAILFFRRLAPRGLISDDVGLGKTISAGLIAAELIHRNQVESLLVVCPKSLLSQWQEELETKFGIAARAAVGNEFRELEKHPYWVTTYSTARNRMDEVRARHFDMLIMDEAHALRNLHGSQKAPKTATEFLELMQADGVRYALMLTATPIQNRLWDIFSLMEILRSPQPNPLGTPTEFKMRYIADADARRLQRGTQLDFRRALSNATIRKRRKDTKLVFPDREVVDQMLTPLRQEKTYIDEAFEAILKFPKLVQYTHARTLMSSPWAFAAAMEREAAKPGLPRDLRSRLEMLSVKGRTIGSSAKIDAIRKLIQASMKKGRAARIIVFTMRLETLRHIWSVLEADGLADQVGIIQGSQDSATRRAIRDFMTEPAVCPILLSTDSGAVGLNLQAGNIIVNYDLPWNPMQIEQRIGRVQRLGQKAAKVIVYNLVLRGTVEDRIVHRLAEKLELFSQAIGEMEELLELCGYDEESQPLETVIMDLIRKSLEQKDVEKDLEQARLSRMAAAEKMAEMRQATEEAMASIRPDEGVRLARLERVEPRLPLPDLIKGCISRAGVSFREDDDGRVFVKSPQGEIEFLFERAGPRAAAETGGATRVVVPGTRAFESICKKVKEGVAHHVVEATGAPLDTVRERIEARLAPMGMVLDDLSIVEDRTAIASRMALKVSAQVSTDRYETIIEVDQTSPADRVLPTDATRGRLSRLAVQPINERQLQQVARELSGLDEELERRIEEHSSLTEFCDFYDSRYREDLARLASHIGLSVDSADDLEEVVNRSARRDPATRTALDSLRLRFVPQISVEPIGLEATRYSRATVEARVRHRRQAESHPLRLEAVPLSGVLLDDLPVQGELTSRDEGWACRGGHIVAEDHFARCGEDGCTTGACRDCVETTTHWYLLQDCRECGSPRCANHRETCAGCEQNLCSTHAVRTDDGQIACSECAVFLDDGSRVLGDETIVSDISGRRGRTGDFERSALSGRRGLRAEMRTCQRTGRWLCPDEVVECAVTHQSVAADLVEPSAVSGRAAIRELMVASSWSTKLCLPGEERLCDETGAILLPDELGTCAATGRSVRRDLLEVDSETGEPVLRRLLARSDLSGRYVRLEHVRHSAVSGRTALPDEVVGCSECGAFLLPDEMQTCPDTQRRACPSHFVACAESGVEVLPAALGTCSSTHARVRKVLLATDDETGLEVVGRLLERCAVSGQRTLATSLVTSSVSGLKLLPSQAVRCSETGRLAAPGELETCAATGALVHPDQLATCEESGIRFLRKLGETCAETEALVAPGATEVCAATGRRVRRSLLARDDESGEQVLSRLLATCEFTGRRTLQSSMEHSSVSGKRMLASVMERCAETNRVAGPGELALCSVSGTRVHPDQLVVCPDSGEHLLRRLVVNCEASGVPVSPNAVARCAASGKLVRRTLLATDDVTGERVQESLLMECSVSGRRATRSALVQSSVSGKLLCPDVVLSCQETGRPAAPGELIRCGATGKLVHPDLTQRCPDSGAVFLRRLGQTCEQTGALVFPGRLRRCDATGKSVIASALASDELSGQQVIAQLLRTCEKTGRRTLAQNLVRSAVSGKLVLRDIAQVCDVSSAPALPEELATCEATGKRVLPNLLSRCSVSRRQVLRDLLQECEVSGDRVVPDLLERCSRTGKLVKRELAGTSEVSGARGLRALLGRCAATGAQAFPDELFTSGLSGKSFKADRAVSCPGCRRSIDVGETARCEICGLTLCATEVRQGACQGCASLVSHRVGRRLGTEEVAALRKRRKWVRSGWVSEMRGALWIEAVGSIVSWRRQRSILVLDRVDGETSAFESGAILAEHRLVKSRELDARVAGW